MATIHNPTNFEPSDYDVLDYLDNKRPTYIGEGIDAFKATVDFWEADLLRTFGADWRKKIGHCVHCGNGRVRWITAVRHLPTNDVVVFGSDCTHRLGFADKFAFKLAQIQSRAAARKVRFVIWNKRAKFLEANPAIAAALTTIDAPEHAKNFFAQDVLRKLDQWGTLSDRQVTTVLESLARDLKFAASKAQEATEVKGDAPTGRTTVKGTVLSLKVQEGHWGATTKMLVKLDNNSKVWVTAPAGVHRDDHITVTATWTPSKDDKSFAFGSRPQLS